MAFDDLIIGSGLAALGTALALARTERRVLCLAGDRPGQLSTYPGMNVPCEFEGPGGLGNYWHGVVPLAFSTGFDGLQKDVVCELLRHFYPGIPDGAVGRDALFVPARPIRPLKHLASLAERSGGIELRFVSAVSLKRTREGVECETAQGSVSAGRAWVACGALGTPRLLERSGLVEPGVRAVSDHVIGYAGLLDARDDPVVVRKAERVRGGLIASCDYDAARRVLYMPRPARFDFARLDAGMAKRAVFGLPTSRVLAGLAGRFSPGLVAEALYNKFGLFPLARHYSVNYIVEVPALYRLKSGRMVLDPPGSTILPIANDAVDRAPFPALQRTRRPELFLPGIHLHGSLSSDERVEFGGQNRISVVDASVLPSIGPEHHSFKMMAMAFQRASSVG